VAEENIITNITARADFSSLIKDLNRVTASLSSLQQTVGATNKAISSQIDAINRGFANTVRSTGQFSSHYVSLSSDVEKFGRSLDSGRLKLKDYFRTWQDHTRTSGGLIRDLARQQVQLQNAILQPLGRNAQGLMQFNVHVPRGLDVIKNKTALTTQELKIMNKVVQDGAVQLINWGKNTQWAGRQLTVGLTLPLAAFGKAAADAFRSADQELTRLTKVYGDIAGATSAELGQIRNDVSKTAKELASSMGVNFQETIALAADIAATGKTGNELLSSVSETTRLAVLGEVDRQEAMKATLAIQSAFKSNTEELSQSINFLNAVENQTSTTLNDLVEAIPKAGPVIKGLGGSVQDLALYLTAMREGGVSASEGANALKSALASLINPTDVAVAKFEGFGIDLLGIVNNNAGNVTQTLMSLQSALDKLDPLQKQQAIEQLFGKFQFSRLNALFENLGRQGSQTLQVLDLMKASAGDLENVASRELAMVTESAAGKYKRAIESLKADLAGVGEQFLNIGTTIVTVLDNIIDFGKKLPEPLKKILAFGTAFTAMVGPVIMLTGLLANFFGYIVKGVFHFKSLFKGGEGWRLLTPEILAAEKAGSLAEQTFYSDAQAATILKKALADLSMEYDALAARLASGKISVSPALTTMAGSIIQPGSPGYRPVNPNHPLVGGMSSSHLNPRDPNNPATLFGLVPGATGVNQKIGRTPQIMMHERLPDIEGLTSVGGVSTGVVASEAARYQALMATLGMQSQKEIEELKKTIRMGGAVSSEFIQTFDDILPITTQITQNVATQSAAVVAELRAGKITVDAAKAKIIALNAQLEADLGAAVSSYATTTGRSIDLTRVPLIDQPVVDASGKSNMRALFRKGRMRDILRALGRATRTRTMGAPYSIETTNLPKFNTGGQVYVSPGSVVPGPSVNADVVPAMLTAGEFVVNREATAANLPLLQAINGQGSRGPGFNLGSDEPLIPGSSREIRMRYSGRQLAHLTDAITGDTLSNDQKFHLMRMFGLSHDQIASKSTRINSSLVAAYDKFFNQGTNDGTLNINRAIDYLSGKPVFDPKFAKGPVVHNPLIAYEGMMADMGIPVKDRPAFARDLDRAIVARLKAAASSGALVLADNPTAPGQIKASVIGEAITDEIISSKNPRIIKALEKLKNPGEVRVYNPRRGTSDRFFPKATNRISTLLSAIIAKRRMPTVSAAVASAFPSIRTKITEKPAPVVSASRIPRGTYTPGAYRGYFPRRNRGGIIGYNSGGYVQALNNGGIKTDLGMPTMGPTAQWRGDHVSPMQRFKGQGGPMMAGFGLQMAGQMIGGQAGNAMMFGGLAMQLSPLLGMMKGLSASMITFKSIGTMAMTAVTKTVGVLRAALVFLTGPVGATIAALTAVSVVLLNMKKNAEEAGKANRLALGGTSESFTSVGIKNYKTVSDRLKEINDQMELNRAKAKSIADSYNQAGPTGVTLSIKQLNEAIKNAKENQKDYVDAFNAIDPSKVVSYAAQIKAQFVAMGMSAEQASNQIFAIIKASEKASQAFSAVSSSEFRNITSQVTALKSLFTTMAKASSSSLFNAEEFTQGLDTLVSSVLAYRDSLIGTKDAAQNILDESDATKKVMDEISKVKNADAQLDQKVIQGLKEQSLTYATILNSAESLESITAKILLYQSGLSNIVDLAAMGAQAAVTMAKNLSVIQGGINNITESTDPKLNPLSGLAVSINAADKAQNAFNNKIKAAKKMDEDYYKNKIKAIDKVIDKLQEEADERIKAIRAEQDARNVATDIQQEQLKYQQALMAGDMESAAQAQLEIQRLVKQKQEEDAIAAIEKKLAKELKKQKDEQERLADLDEKRRKGLENMTTSSQANQASSAEMKSARDRLEAIIAPFSGKDIKDVPKDVRDQVVTILEEMKNSTNKALRDEYSRLFNEFRGKAGKGPQDIATPLIKAFLNSINNYGSQAGNSEFLAAVKQFALAVDAFSGKTGLPFFKPGAGDFKNNKFAPDTTFMQFTDSKGKNPIQFMVASYDYENAYNKYTAAGWKFTGYSANKVQGINEIKYIKGLPAKKSAMGGLISGPGTGTSDSIPALLSNGEFVINAASASKIGYPTLEKINKYAGGGMVSYDVPKMANGGLVNGSPLGQVFHVVNNPEIKVYAAEGQNAEEIARTVYKLVAKTQKDAMIKLGEPIGYGGRN
jgi:TP901 family phage tail tape measure protein